MKQILFIMDPRHKILPHMDTSLRIVAEFLKQGHDCFYLDARSTTQELSPVNAVPVEKILDCHPQEKDFLKGKKQEILFEEMDIIFHRLDPPVDEFYQHYCQIFQKLRKPLQINDPWEISHTFEHMLPMDFADYAIPTHSCQNFEDFTRFIREQEGESVAKPLNECSGIGIQFFKADAPLEDLKSYWQTHAPDVIVQPYRDIITEAGDLRVLVFNEKILGAVLRRAASGSRLSNIHQGGSAHPFEITPKQRKITEEVCRALKKRSLYFVGLDFIGEELSEINITSPTTLTYINDFYNVKAEEFIVTESLKLWKESQK